MSLLWCRHFFLWSGFWCPHHHLPSSLPPQLLAKGLETRWQKIQPLCPLALHQWVCIACFPEIQSAWVLIDFCRVVCCMKWHLPPRRNGGKVETYAKHSMVEPTDMLFLYMFSVFPLFSLSTCIPGPACYGCVLCCRFIWYLPSLAVDHSNSKTAANMGLLNGFPFCFVPFLSFSFSPPLSLSCLPSSFYFCLSILLCPWQVFKTSCARRSLKWTKIYQG